MALFYCLLTVAAAVRTTSATFVSRPDIVPTPWNITYVADGAELADGYIFVAPRGTQPTGLMIFTGTGDLIYLNNETAVANAMNFRPQTFENDQYLTFWAGTVTNQGYGLGRDFMLNHDYSLVYNLTATNQSDFHEFQINADGNGLATVYNVRHGVDTTEIPLGLANSFVLDSCFQELNISTGQPTFTFCPLGSGISIWDSFISPETSPDTTARAWDFCHINSLQKDALGNYLLSGRHTHTVYYIDGGSGQILWRLGGKNSTFIGDGVNFSWQHHARWVGENNFTAADTMDAIRRKHAESVSSTILPMAWPRTAHKASASSSNSPGGETLLSPSQGSLQILSDVPSAMSSNAIMGYGQLPVFAEYSSTGTPLRVVHYGVDRNQGYRVFKNSWVGTPVTAPDAAIQDNIVYVSWNGATQVSQWSLMQGNTMNSWSNVTNVTRTGFETAIPLGSAKVTVVLRPEVHGVSPVTSKLAALDASGIVLAKTVGLSSGGERLGGAVNGVGTSAQLAVTSS
ncbi:ASST-domain-containing protein [Mycena crocata]|nr:ASST-domain-containing protein [Mycena crocata]